MRFVEIADGDQEPARALEGEAMIGLHGEGGAVVLEGAVFVRRGAGVARPGARGLRR
jgi:hypothetical protein